MYGQSLQEAPCKCLHLRINLSAFAEVPITGRRDSDISSKLLVLTFVSIVL